MLVSLIPFLEEKGERGPHSPNPKDEYSSNLLIPAVAGILQFFIFVIGTDQLPGNYVGDLSGHILIGTVCNLCLVPIYTYFGRFKASFGNNFVVEILRLGIVFLISHFVYSAFWTAFVFHNVQESLVGLAIGLLWAWVALYCELYGHIVYMLKVTLKKPRQEHVKHS